VRWQRIEVRPGEKGPLVVEALETWVQTEGEDRRIGPEERLVVIRSVEESPQTYYALSNAPPEVPLAAVVRAHAERHRIEEVFAAGNGEVGLDHYEVRSWVGWQHHMTLALLALWFLVLERRRLGEKKPAISTPQTRGLFTWLLRTPSPRPKQIADEINRVLRRKEEARIYHWHQRTGEFPPRRGTRPPQRRPPKKKGYSKSSNPRRNCQCRL
jgi:hypothetical protein